MEDREILSLYFARSEQAILETDKKYGRYCHYIAYQILSDNEDAKEVVNDTYLKAWNTIPPNSPSPFKGYLGMLSRQFSINLYIKKHRKKRGSEVQLLLGELAECLPDNGFAQEALDHYELRRVLSAFVRTLPLQTQKVFVRRYWYASSVDEIAKEYGMNKSSVLVLLMRTREKLKAYLKKEGVNL